MSSVFKLSLKGIRLFAPEDDETIQFGFPLTLICGQNGTGKTTIIECLKYATTGFLPPNSKGGAFVHDPVLANRFNVTGQVKLAFQNANGKSMLLTRTVQLSRKKTTKGGYTNTFKTLEGQLAIIENKVKTAISSKNAELDLQTPIYLGASPAILEYVIFCHQEDSLWPLSDASTLKKRFDDIFEASKFTKVIDNLKTIKKDMMVDIKLIEQSVTHLSTDKTRAAKIKARLAGLTNSSESLTTEITNINIEIEKLEFKAEALFASNQEFQKTLTDFDMYNYNLTSLQEQIQRLESNITVLEDSDEDLLHQQTNFSSIVQEKSRKTEELIRRNDELINEVNKAQSTLDDLIGKQAVLKARKSEYEANFKKLITLLEKSASLLNFKQSNNESRDFEEFSKLCIQRFNALSENYDNLVSSNRDKEKQCSVLLQESIDKLNRELQHHDYIKKDLNDSTDQKLILEKKLQLADVGTELEQKKSELEDMVLKLADKKSLKEIDALDVRIEGNKSSIIQLETEVESLQKKMAVSNKQSEIQSKISFLKESIATKQNSLNKITSLHSEEFTKTLKHELDETAEQILNDKISSLQVKLSNVEDAYSKSLTESNSLKAEIESVDKLITANLESSKKNKVIILNAIEEDEIPQYETTLADLEESYANVMEDVNTSATTKAFNSKAIAIAERDHNCHLCKRAFDAPGLVKFIESLKLSINVDAIKETEQTAAEIRKDLNLVKDVMNNVLTYRSANKAIEDLKIQHKDYSERYSKIKGELDVMKSDIESNKKNLEVLNNFRKPLNDISRLNSEIFDLQVNVDDLIDEMGDFGSISLSLEEIQKQISSKNLEIKALRQNVSDDSDSKYAIQRETTRMESRIKDAKLAISNMEKSLADINNVKSSLSAIKTKINELEIQLETSINLKNRLVLEKEKSTTMLKSVQEKNSSVIEKAKQELRASEQLNEAVQGLYTSVKQFEENEYSNLDENSNQVNQALESRTNKNNQISENTTLIRKLEKENAEASKIEQNILSNIDYRGLQKSWNKVNSKIKELDMVNAQLRKEEYQQQSRDLRQQISDLNASHAGKIGEIKQITDQINAIKKELNTDYKDIEKKYHEEWIKLQTNLIISNDIQTYSKALDNAIMKYHSLKMEEINKILHELWNSTYKGSDIETIAIKSDVNVQAKGNRSYNYRVVMYKTGQELDMRGRCSAGQKVLTSILIRLALAESFGVNCGIIALDEPTTNLDQENTESLAEALNKIIEFRKAQSNFQLIVITHDETFLTHINGGNFTDHFYRIQRDQAQMSKIYRLPISKIR